MKIGRVEIGLAECAVPLMLRKMPNLQDHVHSESDTAGRLKPAAGFKPAERGPGGGLTATYCTQLGVTHEKCNPFRMKSRCP